ncbi:MAG: hypothetical protein WBB67_04510 [bacterium]
MKRRIMEITRYIWIELWKWLQNLNVNLGSFIIRWGLWMMVSVGLLYFAWAVLHSRNRFTQILTFIISSIFVFVLRLQYLKQAGAVYGFLIIVSVLAAICMPPYVAFLLTPIRGQQVRIKWIIYVLAAILFIVQLIVM